MITTGSKYFYALGTLLLVAAVVYGWSTGGDVLGPLSVGYKGGVGDHLGYGVLLIASLAAFFVGGAVTAFRDADPEVTAELVGTEPSALADPSRQIVPRTAYWPILGAFGVALVVVGVVLNNVFFVAGLIALGAVALEWTIQAWSERATGDPKTNQEIRNRIMFPIEIPVLGALAVGVVVVGFSRVFLTASKEGAVWIALAVAALVFGVGTVLSTQKRIRTDLVAALLLVFAVATIGLGIFGAVRGEREFEHHGHEEGEHSEEDHSEDGESTGEGDEEGEALVSLEESN